MICFKIIYNMLFYVKYMQIVSVTGEKPLRATHDENTTAIGEIASGLAACADDIAMHRM